MPFDVFAYRLTCTTSQRYGRAPICPLHKRDHCIGVRILASEQLSLMTPLVLSRLPSSAGERTAQRERSLSSQWFCLQPEKQVVWGLVYLYVFGLLVYSFSCWPYCFIHWLLLLVLASSICSLHNIETNKHQCIYWLLVIF